MMKRFTFFLLWLLLPALSHAAGAPRTLIALYDSNEDKSPRFTQIHRMLEMPLNHLGFIVEYHDIAQPLPSLTDDDYGIVVWFRTPTEMTRPDVFLEWAKRAVDKGKKLVLFGHYGIGGKFRDSPEGMKKINALLGKIGVSESNHRITLTYESKIESQNPKLVGFERKMNLLIPPFTETHRSDARGVSYLRVRHSAEKEGVSDLIITHPNGGYIAENFGIFTDERSGNQRWYVNPFAFFRTALGVGAIPVPDVSTRMGRRIFYSHIDGDGWNNVTELEKYKQDKLIASQVITREVLSQHPHLAFTIGLITAELDPDCYGYPQSVAAAQEMLALPNVEPASHSHSHPLYWNYFADGIAAKEKILLPSYPPRPPDHHNLLEEFLNPRVNLWQTLDDSGLPKTAYLDSVTGENLNEVLKKYFGLPRSYACTPFNLAQEVQGSIAFINTIAPAGKKVKLFQWSGDTSPFPAAMEEVKKAGMLNMNGGDTRYDAEYPSYTWVAPVGMKLGKLFQVFSSNSNENTYTHSFTNRFFGFRYLQTTVYNTNTPIRVKPFNVYFHIFSGEKQASLNAVRENLNFAETQEIIPVTATQYAAQADGFFTARLVSMGPNSWKITNRGDLQTLRFDHATLQSIDFEKSSGVIGQRHFQGSLYVTLDKTVAEPVINLTRVSSIAGPPVAARPTLLDSRWNIEKFQGDAKNFTFTAQGYGPGHMRWVLPSGRYAVKMTRGEKILYEEQKSAITSGTLEFTLPSLAVEPVVIRVTRLS